MTSYLWMDLLWVGPLLVPYSSKLLDLALIQEGGQWDKLAYQKEEQHIKRYFKNIVCSTRIF